MNTIELAPGVQLNSWGLSPGAGGVIEVRRRINNM